MKAIRAHSFGGPEVLRLETVEDPVAGPGEVVVEVRAAGVNPADTYMRSGTYAIRPKLPYTPGGDAGGVISAIGPDVTEHKVGDRVFVGTALSFDFTGCYAEKVKKQPRCCPFPRALVLRRRRPLACPTPRPTWRCSNVAGRKPGKPSLYMAPAGRLARRRSSLPSVLG